MSNDGQASKPRVETSETGVLGQLRKKSREELIFLVEQLLERKQREPASSERRNRQKRDVAVI